MSQLTQIESDLNELKSLLNIKSEKNEYKLVSN